MSNRFNKTPLIISDNNKFIGAVYSTKRNGDISITKKSSHDDIINWITIVCFDTWKLSIGIDNNKKLIDNKIRLYRELQSAHLNTSPIIKTHIKLINDKINDSLIQKRTADRGSSIDHWIQLRIDELLYFRKKLELILNKGRNLESSKNYVTDEDIERAREFPISSLLDFNSSGFCNCIFHTEDTPSMRYYTDTNSVYCFGCGRSADTISVYMKIYNIPFIDAVKKLIY